jgi:hypothetical protein
MPIIVMMCSSAEQGKETCFYAMCCSCFVNEARVLRSASAKIKKGTGMGKTENEAKMTTCGTVTIRKLRSEVFEIRKLFGTLSRITDDDVFPQVRAWRRI